MSNSCIQQITIRAKWVDDRLPIFSMMHHERS